MKFKCPAPTPAQTRRFSAGCKNRSLTKHLESPMLSLRRAWLRGRGPPTPPPTLASPPARPAEGRAGGQNLHKSANTHRRHFNRPAGSIGANAPLQISARSAGRDGQWISAVTPIPREKQKRSVGCHPGKLIHLKVCFPPPRLLGSSGYHTITTCPPKNSITTHFKDNISQWPDRNIVLSIPRKRRTF